MSKLTFTVGIPAFNESANIGKLLQQLLDQKFSKGILLSEIVVISDGSIDNTVNISRKIKDRRVKVIEYKNRSGKNTRLNFLYQNFKGSVLVLLDADIKLDNDKVINTLVLPFLKEKKLGAVGGNAQPIAAKTLTEKGINNFVYALTIMKDQIKQGHNVYSARGPILAISKKLARRVILPLDVPDDRFIYLYAIKLGFKFQYVKEAKAWYKSPQNISDQLNQGMRFRVDKENLYKYFRKRFIQKQYYIPLKLRLLMFVYQLCKNPIAYFHMKYMHLRIILDNNFSQKNNWNIVLSTKKIG